MMVGFSYKKISNPLSLGQQLAQIRQGLGLNLAEVSRQINVSVKYLEAIEIGQYDQLPGEVYAKNFLKVYARFLGRDCQEYLKQYQSEHKLFRKTKSSQTADFSQPVKRVSRLNLLVTPRIVRSAIVLLLVVACLGYLGLKVKAIVTPPALVVEQPADNLVTDQNFIEIIGQVEPETVLEINGQQVLIDESSHFAETIDLQPGVNIIEIAATKRHGKQTKVYRQVVLLEQEGQDNIN